MTEIASKNINSNRVSLHIAVYNMEKYIESAVRSVLTQTYRDFSLTIWDDGSTDGTPAILQKLAAEDSRVRLSGGHHVGVAKAHEEAIVAGNGRYIGWIDADDLLAPTALAETVAALDANPNAGFVYTDYEDMDESGRNLRPGHRTRIPYSSNRLLVDFMTFHFRLIRRSVFDAVGGIDAANQSGAEDYDLCLRMSELAGVLHIPKLLYRYRIHGESFSNTNRIDQIMASLAAVKRAIKRRGMEQTHEIKMELIARTELIEKNPLQKIRPPAAPMLNVRINRKPGTKGSALHRV